ncbi:hypothetical protein GCM10009827_116480 [Dactylosporangium maewongense]|uniref:GGDEF domain-containing protein n=1 Tax=Dactylosporangium maewongense TaxID=634393 RepID=A0ABN2DGH9_9ACTN
MSVRGIDFLNQALSSVPHDAVRVSLSDADEEIGTIGRGVPLLDADLQRRVILNAGQREWQLTVAPTTKLLATVSRNASTWTLFGGLALTAMLAALIGVLAGSRSRALRNVDRATAALREDIDRRRAVEARLREREEELHHLAFHDALTGLANRSLFYECVEAAVAAAASSGSNPAILFIDLDGFKLVNDPLVTRPHHPDRRRAPATRRTDRADLGRPEHSRQRRDAKADRRMGLAACHPAAPPRR